MQSWAKRDFFTYSILFVLLFIRFPIADFVLFLEQFFKPFVLSANLDNLRSLQDQSNHFLYNYSFILVLVVIVVNRNNLKELNIDKIFILILLSGRLSYHRGATQTLWLVVMDLLLICVGVLYVKGWLKFGDIEPTLLRVTLLIVIAFLSILFINDTVNITKIGWAVQLYENEISMVLVEEIMFRGMLWMFLKNLNFSEIQIVVLQAILFWLSHVYIANDNPFFFWVIVPIASIILGAVVWRTRSITSSTIAHMLFNIWWALFLDAKFIGIAAN